MRRRLSIPAIFLCALSLGVWVGASWHSAAQSFSFSQSGNTCSACCQLIASFTKQSKKTKIDAVAVNTQTECAACLAGALVCDAPTVSVAASFSGNSPRDTALPMIGEPRSAAVYAHPPQRGPPA